MAIEWPEPIKDGPMHYITSGMSMITQQAYQYTASKLAIWENLGPAMTLKEAKQLCEDDKENE